MTEITDFPRPAQSLEPSTGSPSCIALINDWLNQCSNAHRGCQEAAGKSDRGWMPTRLIDVGNADAPGRLIITADRLSELAGTRYVTLSHRWDSLPITTPTMENLKDFQESVPIDALSQTFRESIDLTRTLGIRYIWIDSLCIIQNSPTDWARESLTMGDVYKNGKLNIAALAGAEKKSGLFIKDRDPTSAVLVPIYLKWRNHSESYYCVNEVVSKFWSKVDKAALNRRGWVLQERYLSPRTVYFGGDQIYWECREFQACKTMAGGIPKRPYTCKAWFDISDSEQTPFYASWKMMVEAYTRC